jgi:hypothetical protein
VRHQVARYIPLADSEDTLFGVEPKSCIPHISECFGEVGHVILFVFAHDDDVVHVGENVAAYLTFEYPFCEAGKGCPDVFESFRHPDEAVCAEGCDKACAGLVFLFHVDLVVTGEAIEEGHDLASCCAIDYFVDPWQGKIVLGTCLIETGEVDTHHAPLAAFLLHHDHVGEPCRVSNWLDEVGFQQAVHLGFGGFSLLVGHFVQSLLSSAHRRVDAQAMLYDGAAHSNQIEGGPSEDVLVSGETRDEFFLVSRGQVFAYYDRLFRHSRVEGDDLRSVVDL